MFPYINIFGKVFTLYVIMAIIGMFFAGVFMCYLSRKRGLNDNDTIILLLFSSIGVLLGGHILYGITNIRLMPEIFSAKGFKEIINAMVNVFGGSVFYGGLIGGLFVGFITLKCKKMNIHIFADMVAVTIPLFHSFARVGCFLSGCCYGIESEIGFTAHNNPFVEAVNDVSRFPVQLLEAFFNIILFIVLYFLYKKTFQNKKLAGKLLPIYLISYSVIRFFDEFLRGDELRGFVFGISTSQCISIMIFAISLATLLIDKLKYFKCSSNFKITR